MNFDKVTFKYKNAENSVLYDVSFSAKAGQTIAIIGGTGSEKSTLFNLIPRLFTIESGKITVDGQNIDQVSQQDLHKIISITQQEAVLFKGTIRSNLQFDKDNASY